MTIQNSVYGLRGPNGTQAAHGVQIAHGAQAAHGANGVSYANGVSCANSGGGSVGFARVLSEAARQNKVQSLKITRHAEARLQDRNISLSDTQKEKIADALEKADQKGVRDALVMLDGLAIVANARSKTVITAVGEGDLRQNIFTNIDGAVFV